MKFAKAKTKDISEIMKIIKSAQKYLKKKGINQWQNDYPNPKTLAKDIRNNNSYLIRKDKKIVATAAIVFEDDSTYKLIEAGSWLSQGNYGVIHRAAVAEAYKGKGLVSIFFEKTYNLAAEKNIESIRIDTHPDNLAMQRVIEKEGFKYCGIIYAPDGNQRYAYEKLLVKENE